LRLPVLERFIIATAFVAAGGRGERHPSVAVLQRVEKLLRFLLRHFARDRLSLSLLIAMIFLLARLRTLVRQLRLLFGAIFFRFGLVRLRAGLILLIVASVRLLVFV
jgi:hypothetical protein